MTNGTVGVAGGPAGGPTTRIIGTGGGTPSSGWNYVQRNGYMQLWTDLTLTGGSDESYLDLPEPSEINRISFYNTGANSTTYIADILPPEGDLSRVERVVNVENDTSQRVTQTFNPPLHAVHNRLKFTITGTSGDVVHITITLKTPQTGMPQAQR